MALVIPAGQNLSAEAFTSFAIGRQLTRIRDEQRRRQEEAADQGGAGIGGAVGTAAGIAAIALAAPSGGASLFALGAAAGGGLGQVVGSAIDPPGSAVPGGQTGQIAGGINRISQGVLQFAAIEENKKLNEDQKDEAFLANITKTIGVQGTQGFTEFKLAGLEKGLSRSEVRQSFVQENASGLAQVRKERVKGLAGAARLGKLEAQKINAYMANPTQFRELFEVDKFNEQGFEDLRSSREKIGQDFRAGKLTDQGRQLALRAWRSRRDSFLADQVLRQPTPISIQQLQQAGKAPRAGGTYFDENVPGATLHVSDGNVSSWSFAPNRPVEDKGNPNRRITYDRKGEQSFHSARLPDGRWVGIGDHFEIAGREGLFQRDKDGETVQVKGTGADGDDSADLFTKTYDSLLRREFSAQEASEKAKGAVEAFEAFKQERTQAALKKKLEAARSLDDFLDVLSEGNAPLRDAVQILQNRGRVDRQSILDAIAEVARALNVVDSRERPGSEVIAGRADRMRGILSRINLTIEEQDRRATPLRQP